MSALGDGIDVRIACLCCAVDAKRRSTTINRIYFSAATKHPIKYGVFARDNCRLNRSDNEKNAYAVASRVLPAAIARTLRAAQKKFAQRGSHEGRASRNRSKNAESATSDSRPCASAGDVFAIARALQAIGYRDV